MNLPTVLFEWLILLLFSCSANWSLFLLAILSCRLCIFSPEYPPSWVSLPSFSCWGQNEALQAELVFTDQQTVKGSDFLFHFRSSFQSHPGCVCFSISKPQEEKKKLKIKHNSAICKGQAVTSLCIFQVVWVLEWTSNGDEPPMHGLYRSSNLQRVCLGAASSFQLLGHVWLLRL